MGGGGGWGRLITMTKCYELNLVDGYLILMRLTCVLSVFAQSPKGRHWHFQNLKERDITTL